VPTSTPWQVRLVKDQLQPALVLIVLLGLLVLLAALLHAESTRGATTPPDGNDAPKPPGYQFP
jgi:hypothetical protein